MQEMSVEKKFTFPATLSEQIKTMNTNLTEFEAKYIDHLIWKFLFSGGWTVLLGVRAVGFTKPSLIIYFHWQQQVYKEQCFITIGKWRIILMLGR